jgi:hypothetical protein
MAEQGRLQESEAEYAAFEPYVHTPGKSQLPTFVLGDAYTTPVGASTRPKKVVEVICPRRDCGKTFIVVVKDWWASRSVNSRSCTYCFKAAWLPRKP